MNTISIYLEDDDHKEVDFNGGTLILLYNESKSNLVNEFSKS